MDGMEYKDCWPACVIALKNLQIYLFRESGSCGLLFLHVCHFELAISWQSFALLLECAAYYLIPCEMEQYPAGGFGVLETDVGS